MTRKIGDVLFSAFQCAKDDRQSLVDAYDGDRSEPAVIRAMREIREFSQLQKRIFGTTRSAMDSFFAEPAVKKVNILRLREMLDSRMDEEEQLVNTDKV